MIQYHRSSYDVISCCFPNAPIMVFKSNIFPNYLASYLRAGWSATRSQARYLDARSPAKFRQRTPDVSRQHGSPSATWQNVPSAKGSFALCQLVSIAQKNTAFAAFFVVFRSLGSLPLQPDLNLPSGGLIRFMTQRQNPRHISDHIDQFVVARDNNLCIVLQRGL